VFAALVVVAAGCGVSNRTIPSVIPTNGQQSSILAADGTVITTLSGEQDREPVTLDHIPVILQNAVVAIEDERFWDHNGVDPRGILRAVKANNSTGGVAQGGSTITQQYVRAILLTPQRTFQRKLEEASLAIQLERQYSKKYILEQYLNTIPFGNRAYGCRWRPRRTSATPSTTRPSPSRCPRPPCWPPC
jgi:penicillin-binding protein 1A